MQNQISDSINDTEDSLIFSEDHDTEKKDSISDHTVIKHCQSNTALQKHVWILEKEITLWNQIRELEKKAENVCTALMNVIFWE